VHQKSDFELFESIRAACTPVAWSKGAKFASMGIIDGISESEEEIELKIHIPGLVVAPTVVLYPEDEDWECDCQCNEDACFHVAAAAIAINQCRKKGQRLSTSSGHGRLEYRFSRLKDGISLRRFFISKDNREELLTTPLMRSVTTQSLPFGFRPDKEDLQVDRIIGKAINRDFPFNPEIASRIINGLAGCRNVLFEGQQVSIPDEPLLPKITIEDHEEDGASLTVRQDPKPTEVVAAGIALCEDLLCQVGELHLCGPRLEKLPQTIIYSRARLAQLAGEVIPNLLERVPLKIKTGRLPKVSADLKPRLVMEFGHEGRTISVIPQLVYGNPPQVKIKDDQMVYIQGDIPARDTLEEKRLTGKLRDDLNLVVRRKVSFSGKEAAVFMEKVRLFGEDSLDSSQQIISDAGPLVPIVTVDNDKVEVSFIVGDPEDGPSQLPSQPRRHANVDNVLNAWSDGLSMAPLQGGGFAPLPVGWLEKHGHLLADILAARNEEQRVSSAAVHLLAEFCDDLSLPRQPCFDRIAPLLDGFKSIPQVTLPEDLNGELRPYQRDGVDWLCFLKSLGLGAVLADDMGLGKTLQALCAVTGRTLVVCPTSVLHNWKNEIEKFRPGLTTCVYHGPKRTIDNTATALLTTYAVMRMDIEALRKEDWDFVVLDEAQNIKNPDSQVARAAYKLSGDFHLAISGTPVENRLEELWSLFNFCNRGLLGSRASFRNRFSDPIGSGDMEAQAKLRERTKPFVLRRMKQNVAKDLPPRTDQVITCELSEHERQVYNAIRAATDKDIVSKIRKGQSVMAALEALLRLRQASCHVGLIPGQNAVTSSKVELLMERLEYTVANSHKALVFSQWTSLLDRIQTHLDESAIDYCRLDGTTRKREEVVNRFQDPDGPPVMIISLKAGGTGLNLTAADHVFIVDPWWNPAVEDQAADRTHRIGQDKPVMVYRLVAEDTVEERILTLQKKKRRLAEAALGQGDSALSITKEDLLALLE
jgi:superfamily II DNA or RNA helicase